MKDPVNFQKFENNSIHIASRMDLRAEKGLQPLAQSSRVFLGDVIFDSDWMPTAFGSCAKSDGHVLR